jgi:hypothetical protein
MGDGVTFGDADNGLVPRRRRLALVCAWHWGVIGDPALTRGAKLWRALRRLEHGICGKGTWNEFWAAETTIERMNSVLRKTRVLSMNRVLRKKESRLVRGGSLRIEGYVSSNSTG